MISMPSSCTSGSLVVLAQQAHQVDVAIFSVDETLLPQQSFADEAALLIASDRARIVGHRSEPQSVQVHFVERQSDYDSERVSTETLVPELFLADRQKELGLAALPVDISYSSIADQLAIERFDREVFRIVAAGRRQLDEFFLLRARGKVRRPQ